MICNLKVLTAALAALLAMGAFASIAQAGSLDVQLDAEGDANLIGTNTTNFVWAISGGSSSCNNVRLEGTVSGADNATATDITEFTVTPIITGCTAFGFVPVTMRTNGCKWTFTGQGQAALTFNFDITGCTSGKKFEVEIALTGCVFTYGEQGPLSHVVATNNALSGNQMDTTISITVSGLTYTENANCPTPGHFADGTFAGSFTLQGFVDNGSQQAIHNGHTYNKLLAGAQLEVTAT